jgi:hypothetical protein
MAAWNHTASWSDELKTAYRKVVASTAPTKAGNQGLDCADLSNSLLIEFAANNGLPLRFKDNDDVEYVSRFEGQTPYRENPITGNRWGKTWSSKDEYLNAVVDRIGTKAMAEKNLDPDDRGSIQAGDLMIAFTKNLHHTALVYRVYAPGEPHPYAGRADLPDFPGDEEAVQRADQWRYFRGTILEEKNDRVLRLTRNPDNDTHVDYLNYRSTRKDRAELIYFANVRQMRADGFKFRWYSDYVFKW